MARVILFQFAFALIVALLALLVGGRQAGISSLLAGLCCVLPNALFAFGLHLSDRRRAAKGVGSFFLWEFAKIAATIAMMVMVFWLYKDLSWIAFLVSLAVVLKSYIFLLHKIKTY